MKRGIKEKRSSRTAAAATENHRRRRVVAAAGAVDTISRVGERVDGTTRN